MKVNITIGAMIIFLYVVDAHSQSPCDNPSPGACIIPDTFCVVPPQNCPWDLNGTDIVAMVNIMKGRYLPSGGNYGRFDVNCGGRFNGLDVVYMLNFLRGRGPAPLCCFYICPDIQKQDNKTVEKKQ